MVVFAFYGFLVFEFCCFGVLLSRGSRVLGRHDCGVTRFERLYGIRVLRSYGFQVLRVLMF